MLEVNTTLTNLQVQGTQICDEGSAALLESLQSNTTLKILNIESNDIDMDALSDMLSVNKCLTKLDLTSRIYESDIPYLDKIVQSNNTLTTLLLGDDYDNEGDACIETRTAVEAWLHQNQIRAANIELVLSQRLLLEGEEIPDDMKSIIVDFL
mmetsp:Transcript_57564/g.125063  ORF Transcript_57564/g.125063 Transcript_57564/m.125063 type:complete len:153 (-) Transcript_57564:447-905(-)